MIDGPVKSHDVLRIVAIDDGLGRGCRIPHVERAGLGKPTRHREEDEHSDCQCDVWHAVSPASRRSTDRRQIPPGSSPIGPERRKHYAILAIVWTSGELTEAVGAELAVYSVGYKTNWRRERDWYRRSLPWTGHNHTHAERELSLSRAGLLKKLEVSTLRGMGGARFPTSTCACCRRACRGS